MTQPAGRGATVDFRFRNGRRVHFEAHEVRFDKLLSDVKEYLTSSPPQLDWQQIDINDIGSRLVALNQQQYLGRLVARWELDLEPPPGHLDRRITVTTPLQKAGAYLLTARMDGGNTSHIVVWLDDTVIVKKFMAGEGSTTSSPIPAPASPCPGPTSSSSAGGWSRSRARTSSTSRPRHCRCKTDDDGQVLVPTNGLADAKGTLPVALHRENARGPARPSRLRSHLGTASTTTPPTTRSRSTRSPTGPSIGPVSRCGSSSGWPMPATTSPTPRTSPARPSRSRSRIRRARRS